MERPHHIQPRAPGPAQALLVRDLVLPVRLPEADAVGEAEAPHPLKIQLGEARTGLTAHPVVLLNRLLLRDRGTEEVSRPQARGHGAADIDEPLVQGVAELWTLGGAT